MTTPSSTSNQIGSKIRRLRKARQLKQGDLAALLGMTPAQLCNIEKDKNAPSVRTLERIAAALDLPLASLVSDASPCPATGFQSDPGCVREAIPDSDFGPSCAFFGSPAGMPPLQVQGAPVPCNPPGSGTETPRLPLCDIRPMFAPRSARASLLRALAPRLSELDALESAARIPLRTRLPLDLAFTPDESGADSLARDLRALLGAGSLPFADLPRTLEAWQVRIFVTRLPEGHDSWALFDSSRTILIVCLGRKSTPERQLYRLALELGYACLFAANGHRPIKDNPADIRFARRFATSFLMPEAALRTEAAALALAPTDWTLPLLNLFKVPYAISAEALAIRLEALGLMAPSIRRDLVLALHSYYKDHPRAPEPPPAAHPLNDEIRLRLLRESHRP